MKALTLHEPWASAIVRGSKRIENRTWVPWKRVRGKRIAIHAGLKMDDEDVFILKMQELFRFERELHRPGHVLGTAVVAGVLTPNVKGRNLVEWYIPPPDTSIDTSWWSGDQYGWVLHDVRPVEDPFPMRGKQGLWTMGVWSLSQCCGALRETDPHFVDEDGKLVTKLYVCSACKEDFRHGDE